MFGLLVKTFPYISTICSVYGTHFRRRQFVHFPTAQIAKGLTNEDGDKLHSPQNLMSTNCADGTRHKLSQVDKNINLDFV